jgi:GNAT superfamily N-acetyltransferase
MADPLLRVANESDVSAIHGMIVELAVFEREPDAVAITKEQLREDGWGEHRAFECFVAECEQAGICGFALYYSIYSTWEGRSLYLEDLYVKPSQRGHGIGTALLHRVAQEAIRQGCARLDWSVLAWNEPALRVYRNIGAQRMEEWRRMRLSEHALAAFAAAPCSIPSQPVSAL